VDIFLFFFVKKCTCQQKVDGFINVLTFGWYLPAVNCGSWRCCTSWTCRPINSPVCQQVSLTCRSSSCYARTPISSAACQTSALPSRSGYDQYLV